MSRKTSIALVGLVTASAVSLAMAGLAYGGDLPGQAAAQAVLRFAGLDLPEPSSETGDPVAEEVRSVIDGDLEGCELGQAVADAADANRQDDAAVDNDPCSQAATDGSSTTGIERSADGRATAAERSGGPSGAGTGNADPSQVGSTTSGREYGASKAAEGLGHKPADE